MSQLTVTHPSCFHRRIDAINDDLAFVYFSSGYFDVEDHAAYIVDEGLLFKGGLQTPIASACRHRGVGIGDADLLVLALASFMIVG